MIRALALISSVSVVFAVGCGAAPEPGARCEKAGFVCGDENTAFECRSPGASSGLEWFELPCRGPDGCSAEGGQVTCDVSLNQVGDNCSSSMEGKGICAADGRSALVCRSGDFVKASDCLTCIVEGDEVVCQP